MAKHKDPGRAEEDRILISALKGHLYDINFVVATLQSSWLTHKDQLHPCLQCGARVERQMKRIQHTIGQIVSFVEEELSNEDDTPF